MFEEQMQSIAARFFINFTLCSLTAIAAIGCSSFVPTFGLIGQMFAEVYSCKILMQSLAARFFISFSLFSVTAIRDIDCSSFVSTFGLLLKMPFFHLWRKLSKYKLQ